MAESNNDHRAAPASVTAQAKRMIRDHRDLRVWKKSMHIATECEQLCALFPPAGNPLAVQMKSIAHAVPARIEEGQASRSLAVYLEMLASAGEYLHELEGVIIQSYGKGWMGVESGDRLLMRVADIRRMLTHLVESLESARVKRRRPGNGS